MQIFSKVNNDYLVVFLVGELDHYASDFARSKLDALLDRIQRALEFYLEGSIKWKH